MQSKGRHGTMPREAQVLSANAKTLRFTQVRRIS
jgi:hypothetical protein